MNDHLKIGPEVGDGGKRTAEFIRDEILNRFDNTALSELEDASVVNLSNPNIAISTDSYIVDPPIFPGGDIGRLAVSGTINDLVASGAVPQYLTLALVLSIGIEMKIVGQILDSTLQTAMEANVHIVAGDTKVVPESSRFGICINTTGIGTLLCVNRTYGLRNAKAGDAVIITGTLGDHSLAVLSAREGLGFESRVQSDCAPLHSLVLPVLKQFCDVHALRDITRGGLRGVLCDLAESANVDVDIDLDKLPIQREVVAGCEMLGLDPIDLVNEGKMIIVAAAHAVGPILKLLREHPHGRLSEAIGRVSHRDGNQSEVRVHKMDSPVKHLNRNNEQLIPRLC